MKALLRRLFNRETVQERIQKEVEEQMKEWNMSHTDKVIIWDDKGNYYEA